LGRGIFELFASTFAPGTFAPGTFAPGTFAPGTFAPAPCTQHPRTQHQHPALGTSTQHLAPSTRHLFLT